MPTQHSEPETDLFEGWSPDRAVEAKDAVLDTIQSPGFGHIREAIGLAITGLHRDFIDRIPSRDASAEAEAMRDALTRGQIQGLERVEALIGGIIERGEEAEDDG